MESLRPRRSSPRLMPEVAARPEGGFVLVPAWVLVAAWWAVRTRELRPLDLRVWLASFEAVARRCGARKGCRVAYSTSELRQLTGAGSDRSVREALRRIERVGLLNWRHTGVVHAASVEEVVLARAGPMLDALSLVKMATRRVPVPRRLVRELCRTTSATLLATAFGHLLRCLYNRRRWCASGGLCKASWVAEVFGISQRSVKRCRARLASLGVLRTQVAPQRVMNRHGGWSAWNLRWRATPGEGSTSGRRAVRLPGAALSPPVASERTQLSPPSKTGNSLSGSENQQRGESRRRGAFGRRSRGSQVRELGHVRAEQLARAESLRTLFVRAVGVGLVRACEADALKFAGAAVHARRVGTRNVPGLFATVVRRGLWAHVSQDDEDRARRVAATLLPRHGRTPESNRQPVPRCVAEPVVTTEERERIRRIIAESLGCTESYHVEHSGQTPVES